MKAYVDGNGNPWKWWGDGEASKYYMVKAEDGSWSSKFINSPKQGTNYGKNEGWDNFVAMGIWIPYNPDGMAEQAVPAAPKEGNVKETLELNLAAKKAIPVEQVWYKMGDRFTKLGGDVYMLARNGHDGVDATMWLVSLVNGNIWVEKHVKNQLNPKTASRGIPKVEFDNVFAGFSKAIWTKV